MTEEQAFSANEEPELPIIDDADETVAEERLHDVPVLIFEKFLEDLENAGVSTELVTRLRKALLEEQVFTDSALKTAVLGEDTHS